MKGTWFQDGLEVWYMKEFVCQCDNEELASQIVREHNAHDALVEALDLVERKAETICYDTRQRTYVIALSSEEASQIVAALTLANAKKEAER